MTTPDVGDRWERLEPPSFAPHQAPLLPGYARVVRPIRRLHRSWSKRAADVHTGGRYELSQAKPDPATAPGREYPGPRVAARTSSCP